MPSGAIPGSSRPTLDASRPPAMLEVVRLTAGYGDLVVLQDVSLRVPAGITCVIGPNGAGKSTLLRAIFGMADRFGGRILFRGEDLTGLSPLAIRQRGISYVAQGPWNFPHMTVRENLEMGAFVRADGDVATDIAALEERFPVLRRRARERAGNLSGGEQQVLEMATALMGRPQVLLLDEPSLGLAPAMLARVFEAIRLIADMGVTVLMVEQNARQALGIARHAVVLELGRVVMEAPADAVLRDARAQRAFLGEVVSG